MGWRHPVARATAKRRQGLGAMGGAWLGLYKRAAGGGLGVGVGGYWAGRAQAAGPDPGERESGGTEEPIHSLGRLMGRSRVNAF